MKKILIIEDDELIAELERDYLEASGYQAELCANGLKGLQKAKSEAFDLLILDVMLPDTDGFHICRDIRREQNLPVIFVTARESDVDKIRGLGLGADDYITKPFNPTELVARVNAHIQIHERLLRQSSETSIKTDIIECNGLKILVPYRRVLVNEKEIELKNKEFELLLFLASHPDMVFSKDTLFDRIWGMDSVGDVETITVHINRIRKKIEPVLSSPQYIQTVWGVGYKFNSKAV